MVVFLGLVWCNSKSLTTDRLVFLVFIFVGGVSDNILKQAIKSSRVGGMWYRERMIHLLGTFLLGKVYAFLLTLPNLIFLCEQQML